MKAQYILAFFLGMAIMMLLSTKSPARDSGQWENNDAATREWFRSLKMPDIPTASCCGEADGYYCDNVHIRDNKTYCTITDERPDEPLRRAHVPLGTEVFIPNNKLGNYPGNPTGHNIVFMGISRGINPGEIDTHSGGLVYCYVQGGGI